MRTTNDMFWEIVKSDFSWLMKEKGANEDDSFYSEQRKHSAQVLLCNSFYDLFISPFSKISLFRYRTNVKFPVGESWEKDTYRDYEVDRLNKPNYLGGSSYFSKRELSLNEDFMSFFHFVMKSKLPRSYLTSSRGNAFLIRSNYNESEEELKKTGYNFEFYDYGASSLGSGSKDIIKHILIQYEIRSYGLLTLKDLKEVKFDAKKHFFSFAVNYFDNYTLKHTGDIFFFGLNGLEYSTKNVVTIINSYLRENSISDRPNNFSLNTTYDILEYSHQFNEYNIRTTITFFKETEFIYTVNIGETLNAGRLREEWVEVTARINFYNDEILEFNGSKSLESLK